MPDQACVLPNINDERKSCIKNKLEEQCRKALGMAIYNGAVLKSIDEAQSAVSELGAFHISAEERNSFITDNGDMLFNDYSRKIAENVEKLIERYGEAEGFEKLKEHPEILRMVEIKVQWIL